MKKSLLIGLLFIYCFASGQDNDTNIELLGTSLTDKGVMIIKFKLINSKPYETYDISISFINKNKKVINPFSISGDLDSISGFDIKTIKWYYTKDIDYLPEIGETSIKITHKYTFPVKLIINSYPTMATVYIDENFAGLTPLASNLAHGKHKIAIIRKDYDTSFLYVNLEKKVNLFDVKLHKFNFYIITHPDNSKISIDSIVTNSISRMFYLTPEKHQIVACAEGCIKRKKTITINDGFKTAKFYLKPCCQFGVGVILGHGSLGFDFLLRFPHTELAVNIMANEAMSYIPYDSYNSPGASVSFGIRIPYPIDFTLHAGYGTRQFINSDNTDEYLKYNTFIFGITVPFYLSPDFGLYLKYDYWTHTENNGIFLFSTGLIFSIR